MELRWKIKGRSKERVLQFRHIKEWITSPTSEGWMNTPIYTEWQDVPNAGDEPQSDEGK